MPCPDLDNTVAIADLAVLCTGPKLPDNLDALEYKRVKSASSDINEGVDADDKKKNNEAAGACRSQRKDLRAMSHIGEPRQGVCGAAMQLRMKSKLLACVDISSGFFEITTSLAPRRNASAFLSGEVVNKTT